MANTKKYVSLDKLSLYDEKIKKFLTDADAAALASAKSYADGLAVNYDAAGTAATAAAGALSEAKAYADGKDAAIAEAKKAGTDAAAAASAAQGAADAAQAAADKAQGEVDALETLVGTLPEGATATNVVAYVQEKTSGIATEGAMTELSGRVTVVEGQVATIEGDYLKAADKTELEGKITAEENRAKGIEGGLETRLAAVEGDYLKGADKTELQGKIDLKADKTALEAEVERATGVEESLQTQINTIMNNPDTEGAINSINEFTQYIADHGTIADGFRTDIDKNKDDIAAEVKRAGEAEAALAGRLDTLEAIDHEAYVAADAALKTELTTEIGKKADTTALEAVSDELTQYKDAHASDYTNAQIDAAIKVVADDVAALGDTYATDAELAQAISGEVTRADGAYAAKSLETTVADHVADAVVHITAAERTLWNAALQASDVATGSANGTIAVKGTDVAVKGLGSAAFTESTAYDAAGAAAAVDTKLTAEVDRATAKENELAAAIAAFVEVSEQEINDLFV